ASGIAHVFVAANLKRARARKGVRALRVVANEKRGSRCVASGLIHHPIAASPGVGSGVSDVGSISDGQRTAIEVVGIGGSGTAGVADIKSGRRVVATGILRD